MRLGRYSYWHVFWGNLCLHLYKGKVMYLKMLPKPNFVILNE